jgi:gliding motility-associated lipoprotein GldJ
MEHQITVEDGKIKYVTNDTTGRLQMKPINEEMALDRRNYRKADNINYLDGDYESSIYYKDPDAPKEAGSMNVYRYAQGKSHKKVWDPILNDSVSQPNRSFFTEPTATSLITDRARVYKGGSWKDRAYWLSPATRRFLQETDTRDDLGFRCAMIRLGSPVSY